MTTEMQDREQSRRGESDNQEIGNERPWHESAITPCRRGYANLTKKLYFVAGNTCRLHQK